MTPKIAQVTTGILLAATIFLIMPVISNRTTSVVNATNQQSKANFAPIVSTDNATSTESATQETEEEIEAREKAAELAQIESWDTNDKIYPSLKTLLSNMKLTDDITVIVMLRMDEDTTNDNSGDTILDKLYAVTAPIDKECTEIGKEIMRRDDAAWKEFVAEVGKGKRHTSTAIR